MSTIISLKINGVEHKIDIELDGFTAGELNGIERNTGMKWNEWLRELANRNISSLAWTSLAWIAVRRSGSFVPFDEFEDSIKLMELVGSADPDAAAPAARAITKRKAPRA